MSAASHTKRRKSSYTKESAVVPLNSFPYSFKARFFFDSKEQALTVLKAVQPDVKNSFSRSRSSLYVRGSALKLEIKAADLTALRASFNSVMRSILVSGNVLNAFGKENL